MRTFVDLLIKTKIKEIEDKHLTDKINLMFRPDTKDWLQFEIEQDRKERKKMKG